MKREIFSCRKVHRVLGGDAIRDITRGVGATVYMMGEIKRGE